MPMLRITAGENGAQLHGATAAPAPVLRQALAKDPGPVTIMIHGFKYQPGMSRHCPHDLILSRSPQTDDPRVVSWPRHLGLRGQHGEGVGVSFGWSARGAIWRAYRGAQEAGDRLADIIETIRQIAPDRPIHLIGHSLGCRVALRAIGQSPTGSVQKAILLAAAEFTQSARSALAQSGTQVLNVTSRENDLFDFLMERLITPPLSGDRMLGHGTLDLKNTVNLQLDDPRTLTRLRHAGYPIADAQRLICHWSPYLRPGVFPLYRAVLQDRLSLAQLRALLPESTAPRWSRLRQALPVSQTKPLAAE
ncbi:MAG: alpha/beta hydrolase [Pelagimonas sp.]|jgi:pimeloyl-ACP methyl ester carboxylesterase|nr:alpha/beta hydrolase [Pelagimonas sp.]